MVRYAAMSVENPHFKSAVVIGDRLYHGFGLRKALLMEVGEEARQNPPANFPLERWRRDLEICLVYAFEPDLTLQDLADTFRLTRERIRQIGNATLSTLWDMNPGVQRLIPSLEEMLAYQKPLSLESRKKISAAQGGLSLTAASMLRKGASTEEIRALIASRGLSSAAKNISDVRRRLKAWGQGEIPYLKRLPSENRQLVASLMDKNKPDQEVAGLLDQVDFSFIQHYGRQKDSPIKSVFKLAREAGYHLRPRDIHELLEALEKASPPVPVGKIVHEVKNGPQKGRPVYYVIASIHAQRATEAWKNDPGLKPYLENPVKMLCGSDYSIPTTTQLMRKRGFQSVGTLLKELGVKLGNRGVSGMKEFFSDRWCPVPIFVYGTVRSFYYPADQKEALAEYIKQTSASKIGAL